MTFSRATTILSAVALCVFATGAAGAQTSNKAMFTDYPPYLCVGGGFVAMAGINQRAPLVVIPIDVFGIEEPQTFPSVGDEVMGMQCSESHIELLVHDYKSGRLIMPLYTVQWRSDSHTTVREEQPEDLNLPKTGLTPPAIDHRQGALTWGGNRAGGYARGDWYIWVPQVVDRPNNTYEVHFVSSNVRGVSKLAVTLLEETLDKKKITKSVPLVYMEVTEVND